MRASGVETAMADRECFTRSIPSPVGRIDLQCNAVALTRVRISAAGEAVPTPTAPAQDKVRSDAHPILDATAAQLAAYFAGSRHDFELPLAPHGTTFQRQVWRALAAIPYGTTISYRELAERLGRPRASRAVGLANGHNPIAIIIPCHRVIGADGSLTGYAAGITTKRWAARARARSRSPAAQPAADRLSSTQPRPTQPRARKLGPHVRGLNGALAQRAPSELSG